MIMVNNLASLYEILNKQVSQAIEEDTAYEIVDKLDNYIFKKVYNAYSPVDYIRTYELLNSVSIKVEKTTKNNFKVKIFCDSLKMNHRSWSNNKPKVYVATFVNDGSTIGRPRSDFILYTMLDLATLRTHIEVFKNAMRKKGYIVL